MQFFDLFHDCEEYPDNIAERGVPQSMLYEYVSSTFLNGLINYVNPFWGCVLERYEVWKNFNIEEIVNKAISQPHLKLSEFIDDVLVLAETENSYWFFWFDNDVSDCQVGRVEKSSTTKDSMKKSLIEWIESHEYVERQPNTESIVGNYYEFPTKCFDHGWASF